MATASVADGVVLELSAKEALVIKMLVGHVIGSSRNTLRKYTDVIYDVLEAAGVDKNDEFTGAMYLKNYIEFNGDFEE